MDVKVKVEQSGGKYGTFKCPSCGADASYKFTAASGWCDECDAQFIYTGGLDLNDAKLKGFGDHWIELEMQK
ncbi:MAG: hypothetical protein KDJ50_00785 [Alphaproteobacteria bacterium]|nr:hypothetical protein [Alphaproteobacteria bacterium]